MKREKRKKGFNPRGMNFSHLHDQISRYPFFSDVRRAMALDYRCAEYPDYCDVHGETFFDTKSSLCMKCRERAPDLGQKEARRLGFKMFSGYCDDGHGWTQFHVSSARCATCFTTAGVPRMPRTDIDPARVAARKAGQRTYESRCAAHGRTDFHVTVGRCAQCYTSNGFKRRENGPSTARAEARREGRYEYPAECVTHGLTDHHVNTGKCLTCFNAMGYPRPLDRRVKSGQE